MNDPLQSIHDSYFAEVAVFLGCLTANLDLLCHLVQGVLKGEDADLSRSDDEFADDIVNVMCRAAIDVMDTLKVLQNHAHALTWEQQARLVSYSETYDELCRRWMATVEGVNDIWKLRKPPH